MKSLHIGEGVIVNQLHAMKEEKPKIEKNAHASTPKEEKLAPDNPCYRYFKNHHPNFCPFINFEFHFSLKAAQLKIIYQTRKFVYEK